jgi:flavin reductase (DIM6/NTAB) family NADH-FMN oxidoreductase RutF
MKVETKNLGRQELHELIGTAIAPLPIVFISTIGLDGTYNAAPFSFATPVCSKPPIICVSIGLRQGEKKDTLKNIESSHDFVINVVDERIIKQAIQASADYPYSVDEVKETGLTAIKSEKIKSPRIAESKVSLECRLVQKLELIEEFKDGTGLRSIVFGEVVVAHVKDEIWVDGKINPHRLNAIGRIGSNIYCKTEEIFEMKAPKI